VTRGDGREARDRELPAVEPAIRPARAGDYPAVRAIDDAARGAPAGQEDDRATAPGAFAACLAGGGAFVALLGDSPVGYLLARPIAFDGGVPLTLWIEDVAVHPDYQRRGIAAALYRAFGVWARAGAVKGALARVHPDDTAGWALHRAAGFEAHIDDVVVWRF
jgi:predicted N-acetyltransferase YhbS